MGYIGGIIKQKQVSKGNGSVQTQVLTTDNNISQNLMNKIKIASYYNYTGRYDPKKEYKARDMVISTYDTYIAKKESKGKPLNDKEYWDCISKVSFSSEENNNYKLKPKICTCCLAPLPKYGFTCEYCGTTYDKIQ